MSFAEMLRAKRREQFQTAKDFHREKKLSCSYYHYSKVEAGTVPEIALAVEIIRALGIPLKKGIYTYLRSIMPDEESRAIFSDLDDANVPELSGTLTIHKSLILNRPHIQLLTQDPMYLEATLLIACHSRYRKLSISEIASLMALSEDRTKSIIEDLEQAGLVTKSSDNCYSTQHWIYTPNEAAFLPLKDATIKRALEKYLDRDPAEKWQRTVTRLVSPEQRKSIEKMLEALASSVVALPDPPADSARPYTIGIFSSWRSFGNA